MGTSPPLFINRTVTSVTCIYKLQEQYRQGCATRRTTVTQGLSSMREGQRLLQSAFATFSRQTFLGEAAGCAAGTRFILQPEAQSSSQVPDSVLS